jgi:hypothetical protein
MSESEDQATPGPGPDASPGEPPPPDESPFRLPDTEVIERGLDPPWTKKLKRAERQRDET